MEPTVAAVVTEPGMWVLCFAMIAVVVVQTVIFMRKAWQCGRKMGLSKQQMLRGIRGGAITAIAPSLSLFIALVSFIAILGQPMALARLSLSGSIMYNGYAVECAATAMGYPAGTSQFDLTTYANAFWVMAIGACGWLLMVACFTHKLEGLRLKVVGGHAELLPVVTASAILGAFGFQAAKSLVVLGRPTVAVLASGATMILVTFVAQTCRWQWLKEWSLGLAMVAGMAAAVLWPWGA